MRGTPGKSGRAAKARRALPQRAATPARKAAMAAAPAHWPDLNPPQRLIMGPGPLNADPRVLRALSMPLLGQFDPAFLAIMAETQAIYRGVFQTANRQTFLVDGTARAGIETVLVSLIESGDRVLVPIFGRFGHLLTEIAQRAGGDVRTMETEWGRVFSPREVEAAIKKHRPKLLAVVHGDTSTTMAQPLAAIGRLCREHGVLLYADATATLGGMDIPTDAWCVDAMTAGLQKCLSGPSGVAPVTFNERVAKAVRRRHHVEKGVEPKGFQPGPGPRIRSNYFDLAMLIDYWGPDHLNHHTESGPLVYAARECGRILLNDGLAPTFARHELMSRALVAGLEAMGLSIFGDRRHKMPNVTGVVIPKGVEGDAVRGQMLSDFGIEIGTSFGPLHGRIWRIGTMGYTARKENVLHCLGALEACLLQQRMKLPAGEAVQAALKVLKKAGA